MLHSKKNHYDKHKVKNQYLFNLHLILLQQFYFSIELYIFNYHYYI